MNLYTIGFTKKSAERFFGLLRDSGVRTLVDVRLNPDGQLSGFARRSDLPFFLGQLAGCDYQYLPALAPTAEILTGYRADGDWDRYVARFEALMEDRRCRRRLDRSCSWISQLVCCAARRRRSVVTGGSWPSDWRALGPNWRWSTSFKRDRRGAGRCSTTWPSPI